MKSTPPACSTLKFSTRRMQDDRRQPARRGLRSRPTDRVPQRHRDHRRHRRRDSRRRCADHGRHHHRGGQGPAGAGRHRRDRRERRHPDAGHDRHPPPHVADRPARLRRRLGAEPVLRLLLPAARAGLPPRGHLRGQPAQRARVGRHRSHDDARLVARAADAGLCRGGAAGLRARSRAVSCSATATTSGAPGTG